jgi:hypothetical protein
LLGEQPALWHLMQASEALSPAWFLLPLLALAMLVALWPVTLWPVTLWPVA